MQCNCRLFVFFRPADVFAFTNTRSGGNGGGAALLCSAIFHGSSSSWSATDTIAGLSGGGFHVNGNAGGVNIRQATITRSVASAGSGGGLFMSASTACWMSTLTTSWTSAPAASSQGGAAYFSCGGGIAIDQAITISNSVSGGSGGGLFVTGPALSANFNSNVDISAAVALGGDGGGLVFAGSGTCTVAIAGPTMSIADSNATGAGGGLYCACTGHCAFSGTTYSFVRTSAGASGGALHVVASATLPAITSTRTSAGTFGGVVAVTGPGSSDCSFSGNIQVIRSTAAAQGGAVYITCNTITSSAGVSIVVQPGSSSLATEGGVLYASASSATGGALPAVDATGATVSATTGRGGIAIVLAPNGNCSLGAVSLSSTSAATEGGAVLIDCALHASVGDITATGRVQAQNGNGGLLSLSAPGGICRIGALTVSGNATASTNGGVVYARCGAVWLSSVVSAAHATAVTGGGGGLHLTGLTGDCRIGGAISFIGSATAVTAGGALFADCAGGVTAASLTVPFASTGAGGGAVYFRSGSGLCRMTGTLSVDIASATTSFGGIADADCGGGVQLADVANVVTAAQFDGGGLRLRSGSGSCTTGSISASQAVTRAGNGGMLSASCGGGVTTGAISVSGVSSAQAGNGGVAAVSASAGACTLGGVSAATASAAQAGGTVDMACSSSCTISGAFSATTVVAGTEGGLGRFQCSGAILLSGAVTVSSAQARNGAGGTLLLISSGGSCTASSGISATVSNATLAGGVVSASCATGITLAGVTSTTVSALTGAGGSLLLLSSNGPCRSTGAVTATTAFANLDGGLVAASCSGNVALADVSASSALSASGSGGLIAVNSSGGTCSMGAISVSTASAARGGGAVAAACAAGIAAGSLTATSTQARGGSGGALLFGSSSGACSVSGAISATWSNASVAGGVVAASCSLDINLAAVTSSAASSFAGTGGVLSLSSTSGRCQLNGLLSAQLAIARDAGGALFANCVGGVTTAAVQVSRSVSLTGDGGCIAATATGSGPCSIGATTVSVSSAALSGGVISAACAQGVSVASLSSVSSQAAGGNGGAMSLSSSAGACAVIGAVTATWSNASQAGGAIFAACALAIDLASVTAVQASAINGAGGLLSLTSTGNRCRLNGAISATVVDARASGGAVFGSCSGGATTSTIQVSQSASATGNGGLVALTSGSGSCSVGALTVDTSSAALSGGVLFASCATGASLAALTSGHSRALGGDGGAIAFAATSGPCSITGPAVATVSNASLSGGVLAAICSGAISVASVTSTLSVARNGTGGLMSLVSSGGACSVTGTAAATTATATDAGGVAFMQCRGNIAIGGLTTSSANSSSASGGMAYLFSSIGDVVVSSGTSLSSRAAVAGGCIWASGVNVLVNSLAVRDSAAAAGEGGALFMQASAACRVASSTFVSVSARDAGGAGLLFCSAANLTDVSVAYSSSVTGEGGAFALLVRTLALVDVSTNFTTSRGRGGALSLINSIVTGQRVSLLHARAATASGGALSLRCAVLTAASEFSVQAPMQTGCKLEVSALQIRNATTPGDGGGIFASTGAISGPSGSVPYFDIKLDNAAIRDTHAGGEGGAISLRADIAQQVTVLVSFGGDRAPLIDACTAQTRGGAIAIAYGNAAAQSIVAYPELLVSNATISNCIARTAEGGALALQRTSSTLINSVLFNNSAGTVGGAVSALDFSSVMLTDSQLIRNRALGGNGGGIAASQCTIGIRATSRISDMGVSQSALPAPANPLNDTALALAAAGWVAAWHSAGTLGTILADNTALVDGGGVSAQGCTIRLAFASFLRNSAGGIGGGIAAVSSRDTPVSIGPAAFAGNTAVGSEGVGGGAIALVAEKTVTLAADTSAMALNNSVSSGRLIRAWTTRIAALAASQAPLFPLSSAAVAAGLQASPFLASLVRPLAGPVANPSFQQPTEAVPAGKQAPPALENRTAHILMMSNAAASAAGGDLHLAAATASNPSLIVRNFLSVGAQAVDAGGSMFLKSIPDVQVSSGTWLQGTAAYGPAVAAGAIIGGGCVGVETGEKLNMTDAVFRNCTGSFGGGVFYSSVALQQSAAQCIFVDPAAGSDSNATAAAPAAATTGVIASSIYFSGNAAVRAGGNVYLHRTLPPTCTSGCGSWTDPLSVTEPSTVGSIGYGPNIATGPRSARALPTQYNGTWVDVSGNMTGGKFRERPGYLVVTADTALPDPLISIEIADAYGQQVRGDSRSICAINIVREGSGFLIPLRFPSTYTATSGVVNIWPFAAVVGPGVAGTLQVRCRGFDGADMPELTFPFATASALVEWAPETLNRTIVALPSSLTRRYPLSEAVTVRLVDALGNLLPLRLSCSLVIAADAMVALNGGDVTRALSAGIVSGSSSVIIDGYGSFTPAFSADGGSVVALGARAVWSTGDVLESRVPLLVQISRITSAWVAPGISVCGPSVSGSAFSAARGCLPLPALSTLFASSILAALGVPALSGGASPASASASVLSAVVQLPNAAAAAAVGLIGRGTSGSSLPSSYSSARIYAWPAPTHVLLRRLNGTAPDPLVTLNATAGTATLPDIEVVPLHGSPVWGASLLMPLMQALPGSGDVVNAVIFDPPPRVAVLAEDSLGSTLTEIASVACQLSFSASTAVSAAADAYTSLAADPTAVHATVSASAELAGDLRSTTSRGIATFPRAALRAATFDSLSSCSAVCAWSTSEQAATPPRIVRAGRAALVSPNSEWPAAVVPSGSGAGAVLAMEPPPTLMLNSLLLDATSWNLAGASGAAVIGAGAGVGFLDGSSSLAETGANLASSAFRIAAAAANATLWSAATVLTPLPGFDLLCSARAVTLSLPADISRAAISRPQTVGESDAVLDKITGKLTLKNLGIAGPLGAVVQLDIRCGFVNGEDVRFLSPAIRLVNIRAEFAVQPPALTLPSNPAAPTAWSPSPAVQLTWNPGNNASVYEAVAGAAALRFAIECSVSVLDISSAWTFSSEVFARFAPGTSSHLAVLAGGAPVLPQLGGRTILPADANGYLAFSDLSASGSFGAQFRLVASCRAPSAETFVAASSVVRFLLPTVAWGSPADGASEAVAPSETTAASVAANYPVSQPASYAYYDTEVDPYSATMAFVLPTSAYASAADAAWMTWWIESSANASSPAAVAAAAARLPPAGVSAALVSRKWASVSRDGDLRCQVAAYLLGPLPGQPEVSRFAAITGVTQRAALVAQRDTATDSRAFGSVIFDGTTFRPTYPAAYLLHTARPEAMPPLRLSLELTCTAREIAATPRIAFNVTMQRLRIGFIRPPPDRGLPSPQNAPSRFYPVIVGIYNETGGIATDAPGIASCQLICRNATFPDEIPPADRRVSFFGNEAGPLAGVADFPTFAFSSPLGMLMLVQASCTRTQGDAIASATSEMAVDVVAVGWTMRVPPIVLYNTPVPVTVTVLQYNAQRQPRPAPSLDCTLAVSSKWADVVGLNVSSAIRANPPVYASNTDGVFRAMTNEEGVAAFSLSLMGLYNITTAAQVTCRVGEVDARSLEAYTRLEQVEAFFVQQPPSLWLPTSGLAKTPIEPAPTILFRTAITRTPADAVGTRCSVAFRNAAGTVFTVEAKTGYRITLPSEVLDNKTSPAGLAQYTYFSTTTPIELTEILLGAPFGESFEMVVLCTRAQLDSVRELVWPMRSPRAAVRWAILPPTLSAPQRVFRAAAVIVDRDALPRDRAGLEAVGALRHWQPDQSLILSFGNDTQTVTARPLLMASTLTPLLAGVDNSSATAEQLESILPLDPESPAVRNAIVHLDNVSQCTLGLDADMPSNFQVLSARSSSLRGQLEWPAAAIFAPTGTPIRGSVTCALGSQRLTSSVRWALDMIPCEPGFVPTADGFQCQSCPSGTYSDGGAIHKACVKCPLGGVDCTTGKLQFLTGFYRFDDGLDTLNATSELYPCWNPTACIVNTSTPSRAARDTHRCAEGYKPNSPLCGICDAANDYARTGRKCTKCWPRMVNLMIVGLIPVGITGAVIYISLTKTADSAGSRVTIYFKLLLTLGQTLGTLGSMYVARGTALFREIFGITEAVGSSILEVNPVQCSLRLTYSNRFYLTLLLPLLMAFAAIFVNIVRIVGLHMAACCRAWERPSLATACRCKRAGTVNGRMLLVSSNFSSLIEVQESEAAIIQSLEALALLDDLDDRSCMQRCLDRRPRLRKVLTVLAVPFVAVGRLFTHWLPKGVCWLFKRRCGLRRQNPMQASRWSVTAGAVAPGTHPRRMRRLSSHVLQTMVTRMASQAFQDGAESLSRREVLDATLSRAPTALLTRAPKLARQWAVATVSNELLTARRHLQTTANDSLSYMRVWTALRIIFRRMLADFSLYFKLSSFLGPVVFILSISFSSLVATAFSHFNCLDYTINKVVYLQQDLNVRCDGFSYQLGAAFAVTTITAGAVGIPMLFAWVLWRNRFRLHTSLIVSKAPRVRSGSDRAPLFWMCSLQISLSVGSVQASNLFLCFIVFPICRLAATASSSTATVAKAPCPVSSVTRALC